MIGMWHLLWIIPVSVYAGMVIMALFAASSRDGQSAIPPDGDTKNGGTI